MHFGLTNVLTTFMQMMDDILQPFTNSFVFTYMDDILIFRKTWEEILKHTQQVLGTMQQHKLYANLEKCSFGMYIIQYLGYIMDEKGVCVDPTNITFIHDWLSLKTLKNLCGYLGLARFYHRMVLGFLLYHLTLKESDQGWIQRKICLGYVTIESI